MNKNLKLVLILILVSIMMVGVSCEKENTKVEILMENGDSIKIELYRDMAPKTVDNFLGLVDEGFYDGLTFHRIIDGFMIQGGDPNGDGTGQSDNQIVGEFSNNGFKKNTLTHEVGVISMARGKDYNSASCQFFIMDGAASHLDGDYAAFGKVYEGIDIVEKISKTKVEKNKYGEKSVPIEEVVIDKIRRVD